MVKEGKRFDLIKELKPLCQVFSKARIVKCIFVFGSAVKKYIPGHDIDICIVVDDTAEKNRQELDKQILKIKLLMSLIEGKAAKKGLKLHFQPVRPLSLVWHLMRIAEPWNISALKTGCALYDPSSFLKTIKKLLQSGKINALDEKSERLFSRSLENLVSVRETIMKVPMKMLNIVTIISQMMINHLNVYTSSANDTKIQLIKKQQEIGISSRYIEFYGELIKINEKIYRGTLGEFTGEELDVWDKRIREMIEEAKVLLIKLKEKEDKERIVESYDYVLNICKKIMPGEKYRKDRDIIETFRKRFVDTNQISKNYYEAIKELYSYVKENKKTKSLEYIDKLYFKGMEALIKKVRKS